jgi:hypothetical protein
MSIVWAGSARERFERDNTRERELAEERRLIALTRLREERRAKAEPDPAFDAQKGDPRRS